MSKYVRSVRHLTPMVMSEQLKDDEFKYVSLQLLNHSPYLELVWKCLQNMSYVFARCVRTQTLSRGLYRKRLGIALFSVHYI